MRIMKSQKSCFWSFLIIFTLSLNVLQADEVKFISIGMLQNWFSSAGCEIEIGRTGETNKQQDGFRYPALYKYQDMQAQKGLFVGAKNYSDPLMGGSVYDYKVVHVGPREITEKTQIMPEKFELYGRFDHPSVLVDNVPASDLTYDDKNVKVDENLKADRMLYNTFNTGMGVTVTRKIYAFSQSENDEYFIYDYVLKNTGIYDIDGNTHSETLEDVILFLQYRWAMTQYACAYGMYWTPQSATWGHNTVNEVLHPEFGDDYAATYSWHGLHSKYDIDDNSNNHGAPNNGDGDRPADGFLGAPQFPGVVTIYADKSADNKTNDPNQFAFASFFGNDHPITQPPHDQFNASNMATEYSFMSKALTVQTHAADLKYPHNPSWQDAPFGDVSNADNHPDAGGGGMSQGIGYGPYTLTPGDSVHIILAEAVGTIDWEKRSEIGERWYLEDGDYILPDGNETEDRDEYKDAWVFTGRDSLFQAFDRAIEAVNKWNNGENIPQPPPPPASFIVSSGGDRITLDWADNAESYANFAGYKIYRQVATPDTTFELLYECGEGTGNPVVNVYEDKSPVRGFKYYYYITAFDDGQVHPDGKTMESGLFWTRTIEGAYLKRPPGSELENIRIVPNPYNKSAFKFQYGSQGKNRLMFYNLPAKCDIKIYSERGDLIKTIRHTDGSGDEEWNLITSSRQGIVSGVYIAYFETPEGEKVIKKFVVIK